MSDTLSKAELHAQKACELEAFKSIKLDALKDKVTQMLAHIGDGRIFDQYTKHDISHINKMLESLDYIIPQETQDKMTGADWMLIVTATYFHDLVCSLLAMSMKTEIHLVNIRFLDKHILTRMKIQFLFPLYLPRIKNALFIKSS